MNTYISKKLILSIAVLCGTMCLSSITLAHGYYRSSPVALCTVPLNNTPLPTYSCCELLNKKGHHIWRDTWVSGQCTNANPYARPDMGCRIDSPVYGTGKPIMANCQFSYSTGLYR